MTKRWQYLVVAVILVAFLVGFLLVARSLFLAKANAEPTNNLPAPLAGALERLAVGQHPAWKLRAAYLIRQRRCDRLTVQATVYCAGRPDIDPPCGGRWAAWGMLLRPGHIAVDPRVIPLGSVVYLGKPFEQFTVAVDTGGAIIGAHIDVCTVTPSAFRAAEALPGRERVTVWVTGRCSRKDASW